MFVRIILVLSLGIITEANAMRCRLAMQILGAATERAKNFLGGEKKRSEQLFADQSPGIAIPDILFEHGGMPWNNQKDYHRYLASRLRSGELQTIVNFISATARESEIPTWPNDRRGESADPLSEAFGLLVIQDRFHHTNYALGATKTLMNNPIYFQHMYSHFLKPIVSTGEVANVTKYFDALNGLNHSDLGVLTGQNHLANLAKAVGILSSSRVKNSQLERLAQYYKAVHKGPKRDNEGNLLMLSPITTQPNNTFVKSIAAYYRMSGNENEALYFESLTRP